MDFRMEMGHAAALFQNQKYREAFSAFADIYNRSQKPEERQDVFDILVEAYYAPNEEELHQNYNKNKKLLEQYPFLWGPGFRNFSEVPLQLFPVSDDLYYCYHRQKDCFFGEYDAKTRHQMRYFFDKLDQPFKVENEDNFYNLGFLNDNVRKSEYVARDNHIYLSYTTLDPLERLMLTCDLEQLLKDKKFVFLIGEKNEKRYPINFKKKFGIDYRKLKPEPYHIEEINRIYLNEFYSYSGTDFFEGVLNGSNNVLVLNGWFFYESERKIVDQYLEYIQHPDRIIDVSQFLKLVQAYKEKIKLAGFPAMAEILPAILAGRTTAMVHELWKAVAIAAMYVSQKVEGKQYHSRIVPIIFYDPHGASCSNYYELMKYFKYPGIEATMREPIVRLMRSISAFGIGQTTEQLKSTLYSTYSHSKAIPRWLTDKGFYVAKLEDLKLKPEQTLRSVCRTLNIPYTENLLRGEIGMWGVLFTNEKGEQLRGFDQRSVKRDISDMVTENDMMRLNLFYWPIHHYFRYPCEAEQKKLNKNEAEAVFGSTFLFERQYAQQRQIHQQALETVPATQREQVQKYIDSRYTLEPGEIRAMLKTAMTEAYLQGFDPDLALPEVMFPIDNQEPPEKTQEQRLRDQLQQFSLNK